MMTKRLLCGAAGFATCVGAGAAPGAMVVQSVPLAGPNPMGNFARFDPKLGTLIDVNLYLSGTGTVNLLTAPFFVPPGVPQAYPFTLGAAHHVTLGGVTLSPTDGGRYQLSGAADGVGSPYTSTVAFVYDIDFKATSDLTGVGTLSTGGFTLPPTAVLGKLSNFVGLPNVAVSNFISTSITSDSAFPTTGAAPVSISSSRQTGTLRVTYNYTPTTPEPAGLALLLTAVPLLRRRTRRVPRPCT